MKLNDTEVKVLIYIAQEETEGVYGVKFKSIYEIMDKSKSRIRQVILKLIKLNFIYETMKRGYEKTYKTTQEGKEYIVILKEL